MITKELRQRLFKKQEEAYAHIEWMAQTVHQAYHQDVSGTWRECPRDICKSTQDRFVKWYEDFTKMEKEVRAA